MQTLKLIQRMYICLTWRHHTQYTVNFFQVWIQWALTSKAHTHKGISPGDIYVPAKRSIAWGTLTSKFLAWRTLISKFFAWNIRYICSYLKGHCMGNFNLKVPCMKNFNLKVLCMIPAGNLNTLLSEYLQSSHLYSAGNFCPHRPYAPPGDSVAVILV